MKYLKSFNEKKNYQEIFSDVKELCEELLVYLLDDTSYKLDYFSVKNTLSIEFLKREKTSFSWDDIKEDYIPFIEILSSKYKIYEFSERDGKSKVSVSIDYLKEPRTKENAFQKTFYGFSENYTLEEILNDEVDIENLMKVKVILEF